MDSVVVDVIINNGVPSPDDFPGDTAANVIVRIETTGYRAQHG